MKFHVPLRGGRVVRIKKASTGVKVCCGSGPHRQAKMAGSGNLERLRQALENLKIKEKKYIRL